jgi:formate hydrogenlyase subunit 6/NADH:ubiquinone oxidoreductase subunit I
MDDPGKNENGKPMEQVPGKSILDREYSRRELFKIAVPRGVLPAKGHLTLDRSKCSACVLCAGECPSGALTAEGEESLSLVFRQEKCDSCGLCVKVCPEDCLKLESGAGEATPVVLYEDEFARCRNCGVVIGSRALIERVRAKLGKSDAMIVHQLRLCPFCKGKKEQTNTETKTSLE